MNHKEENNNPKSQGTSYSHVLRYTGIFGGIQGIKLLISLLRNKLTAMILGSMGIGLIGIYNSIQEFIVNCCNFGIPLNATRISGELYDSGTQKDIEHFVAVVRTWVVFSALLATLLCTLFSPILSYAFYNHEWSHCTDIMLVIPIVICLLVAEGECAILKGLRQLSKIAVIETLSAILVLAVTVPFYFFFGMKGVILGLIAGSVVTAAIHLFYSTRIIPYRLLPFNRSTFREGLPMVQKGIPYILAGTVNSIVVMAIPTIILMDGSLEDVGYFRAGFAIMVGYAGVGFVALDNDYFPRLSSDCHTEGKMNITINQQIDVCVLFLTPLLILLCLFMPIVLSVLYESDFNVVHGMTVCASFYTFFRCISLPLGYTFLAKGESLTFLALEVIYDIFFATIVYILYMQMGLTGIGVALSLGALYDVVLISLLTRYKYHTRISGKTALICLFQFLFLLGTVLCCLRGDGYTTVIIGALCFLFSLSHSILCYRSQSTPTEDKH